MSGDRAAVGGARKVRSTVQEVLTEQLRVMLEQRSVRIGAIGVMLVVSSVFSLIPTPRGVDPGWMFIVPVAISAIAGGLKEGVFVALAAAGFAGLVGSAKAGALDEALLLSIVTARFALYGITAAVLGAFAEAHYSVQSSLRHLATTDPLTRVSNVARFYDEVRAFEHRRVPFALLLVDLDDLKELNDRHGHQVGSAAIQLVADLLREVVRASDLVARFGGDEFVVLLKEADRRGGVLVAQRLRQMLEEHRRVGGVDVGLSVSVGIAVLGEDGETSQQLLSSADASMYADKRRRKAALLD